MHRLSSLLVMSVLVLAGLVLSTSGVVAQEATPVAAPVAQHPFVGTWLLDSEPDVPDNAMEIDVVTADGGWIGTDADGAIQLGAWEATGDQTANLTVWGLAGEEEGGGMFIIRASVEVAADGQSFTAEYTLEVVGPDGATMGDGEYGPGSATGTRLSTEPMGAPVGSFEDLFGQFGGEEESTPEA